MLCDPSPRFAECKCEIHKTHPHKPLSILILDCWQREYDKRTYENFQINKKFFEERMKRIFTEQDWFVLIDYLMKRKPKSVQICNIEIPDFKNVTLLENLIKGFKNAETIQLKNVSLSTSFLFGLQKNINSLKFKHLDLSQNELSAEHLLHLRCILIQSDILEYLNVENCFINENTFPILADGLHKSKSIRCINISRPCPMSRGSIFDSSKLINIVSQLIWQNKLTTLILRHLNLNGHDMEIISEYLETPSSKLQHLDLKSNNLTSHGTEVLFNALMKNKALQTLNLCGNNLGSKGGIVIARHISYSNIQSLDISHNQIDCEAMYELLTAIKKPCGLQIFKIYGNKFNAKTASILKRLLRANVLNQNDIDVTYTWDHSKNELCVIPYFGIERMHI
ncbi:uncharacterized protein LOC129906089 [Episyrphus balteatus]|uniref:uncharacterized protein LOC129906089 n=1 Tax=Episyrphus balteatus TaxID=286459 RepID=UPI002484ED42|nr:uncharacterized protein LOC129906089 [Episyrphus balteatus]